LDSYYSPVLKKARLKRLHDYPTFSFIEGDIAQQDVVLDIWKNYPSDTVFHLAAQAGVRYSLEAPHAYIDANIKGFLNILEGCRFYPPRHLIYASSSSVYGLNTKQPFSEQDITDTPASLYAATKKSNEVMAAAYSHLFGIKATGVRFFTVYGPWGRPDMAFFKFTKGIIEGAPIEVYNHGKMRRDFTEVSDVVRALCILQHTPLEGHEVYNIGYGAPVSLMTCITALETALEKTAIKIYQPMQAGDVMETCADIKKIQALGWRPMVPVLEGAKKFVAWYKEYTQ
jgi:UDP-glucuronate 4-epimerase